MEERRREHFKKAAERRYKSERNHALKGRSCDGEAEGLALAVLELLRETEPTPEIPERWIEILGRGTNAKEIAQRGAYSRETGQLGADIVEAIEMLMASNAKLHHEQTWRKEAIEAMESVLMQAGYTCMSAYEYVEAALGVNWSGDRQRFEYPCGKEITGGGHSCEHVGCLGARR